MNQENQQSTRTMEQRQVDWSEITAKIERNLDHSYTFADGQKHP
jgi:hypothetical protein